MVKRLDLKQYRLWLMMLAVLALLTVLAGCSPAQAVTALDGQERDQVVAGVEPVAERFFTALNDQDLAKIVDDFDPGMQKALPEAKFTEMAQTVSSKVGKALTREVAKVEKVGQHNAVTYTVKHEQEEAVSWRIVVTQTDPPQISGLWFDSPKLRAK